MQPASEKCSFLEELSCKEDSLKENRFCFNQNWDKQQKHFSLQTITASLKVVFERNFI